MTTSDATPASSKYRLKFLPEALEEWKALDGSVRDALRKTLKKRLEQPCTPGAQLHGDLRNCYKIKLRSAGFRLVYEVRDAHLVVIVIAVGKRERNTVYQAAASR